MNTTRFLRRLRPILGLFILAASAPCVQAQSASAGLWVGTVALDKVSDPKGAMGQSGGAFEFRILFHVDVNGNVKLLKDVAIIQYEKSNTAAVGLITDVSKIPNYKNVVSRSDGRATGLRYSAVAYDFTGFDKSTVGKLASNEALEYSLETVETTPTNPFRHKYHPDHQTGRGYTRKITINFKGATVEDTASGTKRLTGTYKEVITGLVKYSITMSGVVTLDRVSTIAELNPTP